MAAVTSTTFHPTGDAVVASEIARYQRRGIVVDNIEHVEIARSGFTYGFGAARAEEVTTIRIVHLGGALQGRQVTMRHKAWIYDPSDDPRDADHVPTRFGLEIMPDSAETAKLLKKKDGGDDDTD